MGQEGNKSCWASKIPRDAAIQLEQSALSCRIIAWLALSFTQILELGKSFGHKSEKGVLICSPKSMNRLAWEDALTVPGCPRATAARPLWTERQHRSLEGAQLRALQPDRAATAVAPVPTCSCCHIPAVQPQQQRHRQDRRTPWCPGAIYPVLSMENCNSQELYFP